jgi:hypothetical protein
MDQSQNNLDHGFGNFLAGFASQGILNKDITVWLDGAWPAKNPILLPGKCSVAAKRHDHNQKYICKYKK